MSVAGKGRPKTPAHREHISQASRGKPRPELRGTGNPNYGNKAQKQPEARARLLIGAKKRGQAWTAEERAKHSQRMLGSCNAMRGQHHTEDTRATLSEIKKRQYANGEVHFRRYKISAPEREFHQFLQGQGVPFTPQYHIQGVPFLYDIFIPHLNLLIEYQGDYWHANPRKYPSGTMLSIQNVGPVLVDTLWARDATKRKAAEDKGFRVVWIWEMDYKKLGIQVLAQVLQ